ncbi:hypothetical protein ACFL6U_03800 [Planctomycetota bacterium]
MNKHVAIKCTYNNGDEGEFVGFYGACTEDLIKENVQNHIWCSQSECSCKQYYENGFHGKRPDFPCLESTLFKDWWFGAGTFHTGKRKGIPKKAIIKEGGICLLTTRFLGDKEEERRIIGLYRIGNVTNLKDEETKFFADRKYTIRLPLEEAKQLYFWDYYKINSSKPLWGSGLHRFLEDQQTKKILLDLKQTVQSIQHREILEDLLKDFKDIVPSGEGLRKTTIPRKKRIAIKRKYGAGGEGENHKRLKEWVANNPQAIGLKHVIKHELEYVFLSGDTVDILFQLKNGDDVVVEIETTVPLPGCHQAIKYRALRCAERMLSLDSMNIKALLVAWNIPKDVQEFCEKYEILYYEIKI